MYWIYLFYIMMHYEASAVALEQHVVEQCDQLVPPSPRAEAEGRQSEWSTSEAMSWQPERSRVHAGAAGTLDESRSVGVMDVSPVEGEGHATHSRAPRQGSAQRGV